MPEPNVSWGLAAGSLVMSNASGSSNTVPSRLATEIDSTMNVPAGNTTSRYSMSSLANRTVRCTAPK